MRSHGKDESRAEKISQNVGLLGLYISGITKACLTIILEVLILGLTYLVDWIRGQSNNNPQNIHDERLNLKKNNKKQQQLIEEDENEEDTFSNDTEELNCGDDQKDQRQSIEQNELLKAANSTQHQQKSTVDFPTSKNLESDLQRNSQISDSPVNGSVPLQSNPILSQSPSSETILVNVSTNGKRQSVDHHISSTINSTSSDTERQSPPLAHNQQQQNNQNSFANPHPPQQHLQQQQQHFSVSASVSNSEDEQDRSNSNSDFYEDCREIALKNLSWQLKFDQIQNTLNTLKHAPTKIRFLRDQKSRFSGVVFVKYASAQHALDILSDLQGLRVLDRDVTVELCKYRKKKGKSPATSLTGSRYSGSSSETEIMNSITINNNNNYTRASNTNSTTTTTTTSNVVPNTGLTPSISIQPMIINSTNNNNNSTKPNIGARTSSMVMPRTTSNYSSSDERGEVKLKKSHSELTPIGMNRNRTNSASAPISETNTPANNTNNINNTNNNNNNNNTSPTSVSQMAFDLSPIQIPFIQQQQQMPQQQMSQQQQNGNGFMDVTRQPISPPDLISKGFDVSYRLGRRSFFSYA